MTQKEKFDLKKSKKIDWNFEAFVKIPSHLEAKSPKKSKKDDKVTSKATVKLIFWANRSVLKKQLESRSIDSSDWFLQKISKDLEANVEVFRISTDEGPEVYVCIKEKVKDFSDEHNGILQGNHELRWRDVCGLAFSHAESFQLEEIKVYFFDLSKTAIESVALGLELAAYSQKKIYSKKTNSFLMSLSEIASDELHSLTVGEVSEAFARGQVLASHVNLSRYLVSLPGEELNPDSFAEFTKNQVQKVASNLSSHAKISCTILDRKDLEKEGMGLLLGVGQGSSFGTYLAHLNYTPIQGKLTKSKVKLSEKEFHDEHFVLFGKGVCFDTGGLDIKPASGMRYMKKDMGGAASVLSFFLYLVKQSPACRVDAYLPLVENALGSKSFRPGDVLQSRSGLSVEIHNTDAEGRLALADAMDYALSQKDCDPKKSILIDLATLTGAIKVGLGADIAGYFSNSSELSRSLEQASRESGEKIWRMPLVEEYARELNSNIADLSNASSNPFGGAITASLFLKRFIKNFRWAHLDIYAWTDAPSGALRESGPNGQGVQLLARLLKV